MSTFTVNCFLAGVHHSNDSTEGGQTSSQSGIIISRASPFHLSLEPDLCILCFRGHAQQGREPRKACKKEKTFEL
jgi:hypothetical protein